MGNQCEVGASKHGQPSLEDGVSAREIVRRRRVHVRTTRSAAGGSTTGRPGEGTPASRARATRAGERAPPSRATGAARRARRGRVACAVWICRSARETERRGGSAARKPVQRLILRPGNWAKREPRRRSPVRSVPVVGSGNWADDGFERTGAPCSEVGLVALGNRSGQDDFMVQAIVGRGRSRSFGQPRRRDRLHHTGDLRSDNRAIARATARS